MLKLCGKGIRHILPNPFPITIKGGGCRSSDHYTNDKLGDVAEPLKYAGIPTVDSPSAQLESRYRYCLLLESYNSKLRQTAFDAVPHQQRLPISLQLVPESDDNLRKSTTRYYRKQRLTPASFRCCQPFTSTFNE